MKYAILYNKDFRYLNEVDEIVFDYKNKGGDLINFVSTKFKETQRAVINISSIEKIEDVIPYLNKLKTVHANFIVQINFYSQRNYIELLKDNEIDFMFANFANNYDTFYSMIDLGAEDIYIVEELCFCLKNLQDVREKYGIKLRVIPDVAQSAKGTNHTIPQITKFFIRPEDIEEYEKYIDVIEIYRNSDRQSVIYEIYKNQQWLGNLNEIILDLDLELNNTNLHPRFGQERINCGKRCMYGKCNLCMEFENLANRFNIADISIIKKKKRPELTEEQKKELMNEIKREKLDE